MKEYEEISKEDFIKICEESKTKQEAYHKMKIHRNTFEKYLSIYGYTFKSNLSHKASYDIEDILAGKYPGYSTSHLHNKLLKAGIKEYKCEKCGNSEWFGKKLPLELHHIDGDHNNNSLDNLIFLCPNCHSITDNFKSKKMRHYKL